MRGLETSDVNQLPTMRRSWTSRLVGLVGLLCAGCVVTDARHHAGYEQTVERTTRALIAAGDADSLAAAAELGWPKDDPIKRLTLIARAVAAAPDRPDLVWLNLQRCRDVESCDPKPLEAQLHALDPANGAAWSSSVARSDKNEDTAAVRKDIAAIANSERFDVYWNVTIVHTANAVIKVGTLDSPSAVVGAIGAAAAMAIPGYAPIAKAFKGELLKDPDLLATCRQISSVMRHGDTYITEMIGVAIAKRVWPEASTEYRDAVDAERLNRYRMATGVRLSNSHAWNRKYAEKYLHLLATHKTEQEVFLAEITNAGLSPTPPKDWTDRPPGGR